METHNEAQVIIFLVIGILINFCGASEEVFGGRKIWISWKQSPSQVCPCIDIPPPGQWTCQEQKQFGKCDKWWMLWGDFCTVTCGRCKCEEQQIQTTSPIDQTSCKCSNIAPPGGSSCEQQAKWGKCEAYWMMQMTDEAPQGYCQLSCGRCECPGAEKFVTKKVVPQLPVFVEGGECRCSDIQPRGSSLTCEEQKQLGKCNADWMFNTDIEEGYCQKTCGRCPTCSEPPQIMEISPSALSQYEESSVGNIAVDISPTTMQSEENTSPISSQKIDDNLNLLLSDESEDNLTILTNGRQENTIQEINTQLAQTEVENILEVDISYFPPPQQQPLQNFNITTLFEEEQAYISEERAIFAPSLEISGIYTQNISEGFLAPTQKIYETQQQNDYIVQESALITSNKENLTAEFSVTQIEIENLPNNNPGFLQSLTYNNSPQEIQRELFENNRQVAQQLTSPPELEVIFSSSNNVSLRTDLKTSDQVSQQESIENNIIGDYDKNVDFFNNTNSSQILQNSNNFLSQQNEQQTDSLFSSMNTTSDKNISSQNIQQQSDIILLENSYVQQTIEKYLSDDITSGFIPSSESRDTILKNTIGQQTPIINEYMYEEVDLTPPQDENNGFVFELATINSYDAYNYDENGNLDFYSTQTPAQQKILTQLQNQSRYDDEVQKQNYQGVQELDYTQNFRNISEQNSYVVFPSNDSVKLTLIQQENTNVNFLYDLDDQQNLFSPNSESFINFAQNEKTQVTVEEYEDIFQRVTPISDLYRSPEDETSALNILETQSVQNSNTDEEDRQSFSALEEQEQPLVEEFLTSLQIEPKVQISQGENYTVHISPIEEDFTDKEIFRDTDFPKQIQDLQSPLLEQDDDILIISPSKNTSSDFVPSDEFEFQIGQDVTRSTIVLESFDEDIREENLYPTTEVKDDKLLTLSPLTQQNESFQEPFIVQQNQVQQILSSNNQIAPDMEFSRNIIGDVKLENFESTSTPNSEDNFDDELLSSSIHLDKYYVASPTAEDLEFESFATSSILNQNSGILDIPYSDYFDEVNNFNPIDEFGFPVLTSSLLMFDFGYPQTEFGDQSFEEVPFVDQVTSNVAPQSENIIYGQNFDAWDMEGVDNALFYDPNMEEDEDAIFDDINEQKNIVSLDNVPLQEEIDLAFSVFEDLSMFEKSIPAESSVVFLPFISDDLLEENEAPFLERGQTLDMLDSPIQENFPPISQNLKDEDTSPIHEIEESLQFLPNFLENAIEVPGQEIEEKFDAPIQEEFSFQISNSNISQREVFSSIPPPQQVLNKQQVTLEIKDDNFVLHVENLDDDIVPVQEQSSDIQALISLFNHDDIQSELQFIFSSAREENNSSGQDVNSAIQQVLLRTPRPPTMENLNLREFEFEFSPDSFRISQQMDEQNSVSKFPQPEKIESSMFESLKFDDEHDNPPLSETLPFIADDIMSNISNERISQRSPMVEENNNDLKVSYLQTEIYLSDDLSTPDFEPLILPRASAISRDTFDSPTTLFAGVDEAPSQEEMLPTSFDAIKGEQFTPIFETSQILTDVVISSLNFEYIASLDTELYDEDENYQRYVQFTPSSESFLVLETATISTSVSTPSFEPILTPTPEQISDSLKDQDDIQIGEFSNKMEPTVESFSDFQEFVELPPQVESENDNGLDNQVKDEFITGPYVESSSQTSSNMMLNINLDLVQTRNLNQSSTLISDSKNGGVQQFINSPQIEPAENLDEDDKMNFKFPRPESNFSYMFESQSDLNTSPQLEEDLGSEFESLLSPRDESLLPQVDTNLLQVLELSDITNQLPLLDTNNDESIVNKSDSKFEDALMPIDECVFNIDDLGSFVNTDIFKQLIRSSSEVQDTLNNVVQFPVTVFVTNDDGFLKFLQDNDLNVEFLLADPFFTLSTIVLPNVMVTGAMTSDDMEQGMTMQSIIQGHNMSVMEQQNQESMTQMLGASGEISNILLADIKICEATFHIVDAVHLPQLGISFQSTTFRDFEQNSPTEGFEN